MLIATLALTLPACAARTTRPAANDARVREVREGLASYYGREFHGRATASGAPFDMNAMVAAHPSYPFGTVVRVTNLRNGQSVQLRILDRGPAKGPQAAGVIIDVSYGAAERLGFVREGRTRVRVEVLKNISDLGSEIRDWICDLGFGVSALTSSHASRGRAEIRGRCALRPDRPAADPIALRQ
jgi:rare lipoprotein A